MKFTKSSVGTVDCYDDPTNTPAPALSTPFDAQTGKASGTLQNGAYAEADWKFIDGGAPANDKVWLIVCDENDNVILKVPTQTPTPLGGTPGGVTTLP